MGVFPSMQLAQGGPSSIWNPTSFLAPVAFSNGNKTATINGTSASNGASIGTVSRSSGKRYFEVLVSLSGLTGRNNYLGIAISPGLPSPFYGKSGSGAAFICGGDFFAAACGLLAQDSGQSLNGYGSNFIASILSGGPAVIQCAPDLDNHLIWFGINNTFYGWNSGPVAGNPASGSNGVSINGGSYFPGFEAADSSSSSWQAVGVLATHQADFAFAPPTGFRPWAQ